MTVAKLFRFTDEDLKILARIKKRYGFTSESQVVRVALRQLNEDTVPPKRLSRSAKTPVQVVGISANRINTLIGLASLGGNALTDSERLYE